MDFIGCTIAFHPRCRIDRLIGKTLNHCSVQYAPPQEHETQRQNTIITAIRGNKTHLHPQIVEIELSRHVGHLLWSVPNSIQYEVPNSMFPIILKRSKY